MSAHCCIHSRDDDASLISQKWKFLYDRDRRSRPEPGAWGGFLYFGRLGGALLIPHYSLFIALSLCLKKGLPLPFGLAIFDFVPTFLRGNEILMLCVKQFWRVEDCVSNIRWFRLQIQ